MLGLHSSGVARPMSNVLGAMVPETSRSGFNFNTFVRWCYENSQRTSFQSLPFDLFIDEISTYLHIEDILSLRQVNRTYYLLTHEPIIWKRFMLRMPVPIPPLRPSFNWADVCTGFEIEQLVTQAITADDNWRGNKPTFFNTRSFSGHMYTTETFLLPGGKYMFTSCNTGGRLTSRSQFFLTLWMLDHPDGPRALARIPTYSRAFKLEAKFIDFFDGEKGIIASYVRRKFRHPEVQDRRANEAHHSHKHPVDVEGGFSWEVVTIYTSIQAMEDLAHPDIAQGSPEYQARLKAMQGPFRELAIVSASSPVSHLCLIDHENSKLLAMILGTKELHFVNLRNFKEKTTMVFRDHWAHEGKPHRIRAFKCYPGQGNMLLVRSCSPEPGVENHLVEWMDFPKYLGTVRAGPRARYVLHGKQIRDFQISDYGLPGKKKANPNHPTFRHTFGPPAPLSIYMMTESEEGPGIEHHAVYPKQKPVAASGDKPAGFKYEYDHDTYQMSAHLCAEGRRPIVLPGAYRAVVALIDPNDRTDAPKLQLLRRYVHPKNGGQTYEPDHPEDEDHGPWMRNGRLPLPKAGIYKTIETGGALEAINKLGGATHMAWDEHTGRVVVVPGDGRTLVVMDGSQLAAPDKRLSRWKERVRTMFPAELHPATANGDLEVYREIVAARNYVMSDPDP